ncbi:MAG: alpha/beta hydrolase-fold protein [Thioalkalispiraceae bacterium]|jgi:pimeloyl-ACP methyl ester carboxylesterase
MKNYLAFALLPLLFSCSLYPTVPMEVSRFDAGEKPARHLIVLISGRGASASYFQDNRWVEIAREHGIQADFVSPYAHYGYYMTRALLPRLKEDVIIPAKQQGYQTISLVGISMGGLGSILYSQQHPEDIDRIYLLAPYLGDNRVHQQIRAQGGLANWEMQQENADDWNYYIWQFLKEFTQHPRQRENLFLGYGQQDTMQGVDILQQSLPDDQVITIPGGHKDVVFTRLWELMLVKGFLDVPHSLAKM